MLSAATWLGYSTGIPTSTRKAFRVLNNSKQMSVLVSPSFIGEADIFTPINVTDFIASVTFTDTVGIGHDTMSTTIITTRQKAEKWITDGLARHVSVYNPETSQVWEGFINQVNVSLGDTQLTIGPLLEIANQVQVTYTNFYTGGQSATSVQTDDESITRFGQHYKKFSADRMSESMAQVLRNSFLGDNAYPKVTPEFSAGDTASVQIEGLGYAHLMKNYFYYRSADTQIRADEKLVYVLSQEPNGVFSFDYSNIDENNVTVNGRDVDFNTAESVVASLVTLGSSTFDRMIFGIYEGRKAHYSVIPENILYTMNNGHIRNSSFKTVRPWDVEIGNWLVVGDLGLPLESLSRLRTNQNTVFIESKTFTSPYEVQVQGDTVSKIPQMVARIAGF